MQADDLLRKLAPECLNEEVSAPEEPADENIPEEVQRIEVVEAPILQESRPVLCMMGWMVNNCDFGGWNPPKRVMTNVNIG
jgi:hypothetical protein